MNKDFMKFISSDRIHIIPNDFTKNMANILQSINNDTTKDAFLQSRYYTLQSFAKASPQSEHHEDSLAVQKPIGWTVDKLSKFKSILPENPIESIMEQATLRLRNDIDEHFRGILKRRGISEEEWKQYGSYNTNGKLFEYCYKGECIFKVTYPESELTPGSTEGNMKVYYWEVN